MSWLSEMTGISIANTMRHVLDTDQSDNRWRLLHQSKALSQGALGVKHNLANFGGGGVKRWVGDWRGIRYCMYMFSP